MGKPALVVTGIEAGYTKGLPILSDVSVTAMRGAVTVIIGPNGAGKSTLIKAIAGLVRVSQGDVRLDRRDITGPIAVPATGSAWPWQTVTKKGIVLSAGTQVLRLVMDKNSDNGWVANFDSIHIAAED